MNERRSRRKPGENRARLLEAGLIEFGLFGYHGASTSAIAQRADVPQPHVYVNFGSKQELFVACLQTLLSEAPDDSQKALGPSQSLILYQGIAMARTPDLLGLRPVLEAIHAHYGEPAVNRALLAAAAHLQRSL